MCKNLSPTKTRRGICLVLPHTGYALGCWFETSSDKLQNVSQSVSVSSLKTVCLITVKFLKVSSGKCQQYSDDAVKISNIFGFSTFKGSVLTYCRWGGNLCDFYIENFLTNHLVKKNWKSIHVCQSYYQTSSGLLFWNTVYFCLLYSLTSGASPLWPISVDGGVISTIGSL